MLIHLDLADCSSCGPCFGSVNPLINCRNDLLKAEGPLYSVYGVKHTIQLKHIREFRNVGTRGMR
jgi:hypothetical protein